MEIPRKHYWLYALKLEHGKYYVGITSLRDPNIRIEQHRNLIGARWTLRHRVRETMEIRNLGYVTKEEAEQEEQSLTLELMDMYGYKNVRGGRLTYTGSIYRLGHNRFIMDWQLQSLGIALLLLALSLYILTHLNK